MCLDCQILTIKTKKVRGDRFVNSEGNVMSNSGINYYCGKPFGYKVRNTDGHCGPNNGP